MRFEWDPAKAVSNIAKHGVSFTLAQEVWDDPLHVVVPERVVDGEERWQAFGMVDGVTLLVVAHGFVNFAHAAATQQPLNAVDADQLAEQAFCGQRRLRIPIDGGLDGFHGEQGFDFLPQLVVSATGMGEIVGSFQRRKFQRMLQNRFDLLSPLRCHNA